MLLEQIGIPYRLLSVDVDESWTDGEAPGAFVRRLAMEKARAALGEVARRKLPEAPVLAADTVVALERRVLGKPRDPDEACAMLARLSGREHRVLTAVALAFRGKLATRLSVSRVRFARLSRARISAYVATGEPLDKAGAYAIQGRAAAFVQNLAGSYSGVMGLPLYETSRLLSEAGLPTP